MYMILWFLFSTLLILKLTFNYVLVYRQLLPQKLVMKHICDLQTLSTLLFSQEALLRLFMHLSTPPTSGLH